MTARETHDDSETFVAEVCWQYYVNGMTQADVAKHLDVTRLRVNQAIQRAKSLGIVRIQINFPFTARFEQQEALRGHLGLRRVLIAPARRDRYDYHTGVGAALAAFLPDCLRQRRWRSVGVSWGLSLQHAFHRLPQQSHPDLEIVSMIGGTMRGASFNAFGIASGFATALGAKYSLLAAPVFLSDGIDRAAFLAQQIFADHFAKFEALDAAILTAGDVSDRSFLVANGLPDDVSVDELTGAGAIGDLLGRMLLRDGTPVAHPLNDRTIGIALDTVRRIPEKILVAAGPHKVAIIRAAARQGFVDTLITDDVTADLLLADRGERAGREAGDLGRASPADGA